MSLRGYTIIRELGKGSFGTTYLVKSTDNNNLLYALKHFTFPEHNPNNYATAKRLFQREVAILQTLNGNAQIPDFIDYWEEHQEYYLVQEFLSGDLLRKELKEDEKSEADVVEFLTEILAILQVIHDKKIIHRDINPNNIMRRSCERQLVLIYFGAGAIRKFVKNTTLTQLQTPPTIIYTPGYAPIEQIQGHPEFNSDIYAVGIIAIQMLTGIEPHDVQMDENGEIIWRSQLQVSEHLANILTTMVRYDYRSQYQCVDKVLEDLLTGYHTPTQILPSKTNLAPSPSSSTRNPIYVILFCLLAGLSTIAILSAAGILPVNQPCNQQQQGRMI